MAAGGMGPGSKGRLAFATVAFVLLAGCASTNEPDPQIGGTTLREG